MAIWSYVWSASGDVRPLTVKEFYDFFRDGKPLLDGKFEVGEFMKSVVLMIEMVNRKPERIIKIDWMKVRLNPDKTLDTNHEFEDARIRMSRAFDGMGLGSSSSKDVKDEERSNVVNAVRRFEDRRLAALHEWKVDSTEWEALRTLVNKRAKREILSASGTGNS